MLLQGTGPEVYDRLPLAAKERLREDKESLPYFNPADLDSVAFTFFVEVDEKQGLIRGVVKLQRSIFATPTHPFLGLNYVTVREEFRGQGVARKLLTAVFATYQGKYLLGTEFSAEGRQLKGLCQQLAREYQVFWVDHDLLRSLAETGLPATSLELYRHY